MELVEGLHSKAGFEEHPMLVGTTSGNYPGYLIVIFHESNSWGPVPMIRTGLLCVGVAEGIDAAISVPDR